MFESCGRFGHVTLLSVCIFLVFRWFDSPIAGPSQCLHDAVNDRYRATTIHPATSIAVQVQETFKGEELRAVSSTQRIGNTDKSYPTFPMFVRDDQLFLQATENASTPWHVGPIRRDEEHVYFNFYSAIRSVVIDVGTNRKPDSKRFFWKNDTIGLLWFDPSRSVLKVPLRKIRFRSQDTARVMPFAAAIAPNDGTMTLHVAHLGGCSSLLPLSDTAQRNAKLVGEGDTEKLHKSCTSESKTEIVPAVSGQSVMALIHPGLEVPLLAIDAQGFDLMVLSSFGLSAARANVILLECQDLPAGHPLFLTVGAASCADIKHCIESTLPHRMIDGPSGNPAHACQVNNPTTSERNCAFRRMDRNYWWGGTWRPKVFGLPFVPLKGNVSKGFTCPVMGPSTT